MVNSNDKGKRSNYMEKIFSKVPKCFEIRPFKTVLRDRFVYVLLSKRGAIKRKNRERIRMNCILILDNHNVTGIQGLQ